MNYRMAICDDEPVYVKKIRAYLPDLETDSYIKPNLLLEAVRSGKVYDVVFLDIMMPNLDGISLARELREISEDMIIVFITSKIEFMQTGYEVKAFRYLLKEQLVSGFEKVFCDIVVELEAKKEEFFTYEFEQQTYIYHFREILYFESNLRRVMIHLKNGTGSFYAKLDDIESKYTSFVRIHKSFLVNRRYIRSVAAGTVILLNGEALPISRKYSVNFGVI